MACRRSGVRAPVAPPNLLTVRCTVIGMVEGHSFSIRPPVVKSKRATRAVVGRLLELEAISRRSTRRSNRSSAISLEGEPGIGKTTLINAAAEIAAARGMTARHRRRRRGDPRSAAAGAGDLRQRRAARRHVRREPPRPSIGPGARCVARTSRRRRCRPTSACCALSTWLRWRCWRSSRERPIALLLDDLQWADQDSIRLLRYIVRANSSAPMFLMLDDPARGDGPGDRDRQPAGGPRTAGHPAPHPGRAPAPGRDGGDAQEHPRWRADAAATRPPFTPRPRACRSSSRS